MGAYRYKHFKSSLRSWLSAELVALWMIFKLYEFP